MTRPQRRAVNNVDLGGEGDGVLSSRETGSTDVLGPKREKPVKCLKRIRACSPKKGDLFVIVQLKCLHTNACSMGNKEQKLEVTVKPEKLPSNHYHCNMVG